MVRSLGSVALWTAAEKVRRKRAAAASVIWEAAAMADVLKLASWARALREGEVFVGYSESFFRNPSEILEEGVIIGERERESDNLQRSSTFSCARIILGNRKTAKD